MPSFLRGTDIAVFALLDGLLRHIGPRVEDFHTVDVPEIVAEIELGEPERNLKFCLIGPKRRVDEGNREVGAG